MSINTPIVQDPNGLQRPIFLGDLQFTQERVPAVNSGTAVTLTGALLGLGMYLSSGASAVTLTADTAANIVAALAPQFGYNQNASAPGGTAQYSAIPAGSSFRFRVVATTAFAVTIAATANTGIVVNRGVTAASTSRDFLVTFTNGTPGQTYSVNSTNGSAVISGLNAAQFSSLSVGMIVTNAALGLQGATILSINTAAGTVTMSANATSTAIGTALTFSPVITIDGI